MAQAILSLGRSPSGAPLLSCSCRRPARTPFDPFLQALLSLGRSPQGASLTSCSCRRPACAPLAPVLQALLSLGCSIPGTPLMSCSCRQLAHAPLALGRSSRQGAVLKPFLSRAAPVGNLLALLSLLSSRRSFARAQSSRRSSHELFL